MFGWYGGHFSQGLHASSSALWLFSLMFGWHLDLCMAGIIFSEVRAFSLMLVQAFLPAVGMMMLLSSWQSHE